MTTVFDPKEHPIVKSLSWVAPSVEIVAFTRESEARLGGAPALDVRALYIHNGKMIAGSELLKVDAIAGDWDPDELVEFNATIFPAMVQGALADLVTQIGADFPPSKAFNYVQAWLGPPDNHGKL